MCNNTPYQIELVEIVAFVQQVSKFRETESKNNRFLDKICLNSRPSGTPAELAIFTIGLGGGREMGCLMNSLPDEYYVIQIDGRIKSGHRRVLDALKEGLQLRDQFPHHDIKVRAIESERRAA